MIETRTKWDDSGYDCDHCGGQIYKRTDFESGQTPTICYQCRECSCQWSLKGDVQRTGNLRVCRVAQRNRAASSADDSGQIPVWGWAVLAILFLFLVVRFGGMAALRILVPIALAIIAIVYAFRLGKEREWW
ncbi:MAG: DUF4870 domain-containing protein [Chloroflexi bacterium]|nr:DUF4870 domain-containing protein [Chloroflexota bacterium]